MSALRVLLVSRGEADTNAIVAAIKGMEEDINLDVIYRDYHFSTDNVDVIIGYGLCKTRNDDGVSHSIYFPEAKQAAANCRIPYVSLKGLFGLPRSGYPSLVSPKVAVRRLKRAINHLKASTTTK